MGTLRKVYFWSVKFCKVEECARMHFAGREITDAGRRRRRSLKPSYKKQTHQSTCYYSLRHYKIRFFKYANGSLDELNELTNNEHVILFFTPKYCDKIRTATLIARNKIVESHVTVILTVNGSSLRTFFSN